MGVGLYMNSRLLDISPRAEALARFDLQETVRKAVPFEDWNKPFAEFTAVQAVQMPMADR